MSRAFFLILIITTLAAGCTQRVACPAFQSAYIYDKEELRKRFSYFQEDSTPKVFTASKNKYLVAEPMSYRRKVRAMQTVPMKPVYVNVPDSFKIEEGILMDEDGVIPGAELDMAARSVIDSIYIEDVPQDTLEEGEMDSVYVISRDKEVRVLKYDFPDSLIFDEATGRYIAETPRYTVTEIRFNVEQDNYMWYLRDYLVLPDVRLASISHRRDAGDKGRKENKEKKGFFRNLFGKNKDEVDSANLPPPPPKKEFDFVDEDEQLKPKSSAPEPQEEEKKGVLSRKRKEQADAPDDGTIEEKPARKKKEKKRKKAEETVAPQDEQKPQDEDEDDGF